MSGVLTGPDGLSGLLGSRARTRAQARTQAIPLNRQTRQDPSAAASPASAPRHKHRRGQQKCFVLTAM
jgi:hypothetical protein